MTTGTGIPSTAKVIVGLGAALQLGGAVAVLLLRAGSDGAVSDRLGAVPLAVVYGLPGLVALLARRGRGPLLVAAGIASLVLAVFPFSLHSFVFVPIGIGYLAAYMRWPGRTDGSRATAAALTVPVLVMAAFLVLVVHDDPVCYTEDASGEVTIDRDPGPVTSGSQTIGPDSDVVGGGCSSDTVVWWEAAGSLALSALAIIAALALVRRDGGDVTGRPRDAADARPAW